MITFKEYTEEFAKKLNVSAEYIFRGGLAGTLLEEFTKGYAKLAIADQKSSDVAYHISSKNPLNYSPLIQLI